MLNSEVTKIWSARPRRWRRLYPTLPVNPVVSGLRPNSDMKTIKVRGEGASCYDETPPPAQEWDATPKPIVVRRCCIDDVIVNDDVAMLVGSTEGKENGINFSGAKLLFEVDVVHANRNAERWIGTRGALDRRQRCVVIMSADNDNWVDATP